MTALLTEALRLLVILEETPVESLMVDDFVFLLLLLFNMSFLQFVKQKKKKGVQVALKEAASLNSKKEKYKKN